MLYEQMDENSKEQFRWRFWYLAVILNGMILFYALFVVALTIFPKTAKIPGAIIFLILAIILTIVFRKRYYITKAWLNEHA